MGMRGGMRGPESLFSTGGLIAQYLRSDLSTSDQAAVASILSTAETSLKGAFETQMSAFKTAHEAVGSGATVDTGALAAVHTAFVASATSAVSTATGQLASYIDPAKAADFAKVTQGLVTRLSETPKVPMNGMMGGHRGKGGRGADERNEGKGGPGCGMQGGMMGRGGPMMGSGAAIGHQDMALIRQFETRLATIPDASKATTYANIVTRLTTLQSSETNTTKKNLYGELIRITQRELKSIQDVSASGINLDSIFSGQ